MDGADGVVGRDSPAHMADEIDAAGPVDKAPLKQLAVLKKKDEDRKKKQAEYKRSQYWKAKGKAPPHRGAIKKEAEPDVSSEEEDAPLPQKVETIKRVTRKAPSKAIKEEDDNTLRYLLSGGAIVLGAWLWAKTTQDSPVSSAPTPPRAEEKTVASP